MWEHQLALGFAESLGEMEVLSRCGSGLCPGL